MQKQHLIKTPKDIEELQSRGITGSIKVVDGKTYLVEEEQIAPSENLGLEDINYV